MRQLSYWSKSIDLDWISIVQSWIQCDWMNRGKCSKIVWKYEWASDMSNNDNNIDWMARNGEIQSGQISKMQSFFSQLFSTVFTNKSHNLCAVALFKLISSRLMEWAIWFPAQNVIIHGLILCANNNKHIRSMDFNSKTALNFIYERFFVLLIWIFRCFFRCFALTAPCAALSIGCRQRRKRLCCDLPSMRQIAITHR